MTDIESGNFPPFSFPFGLIGTPAPFAEPQVQELAHTLEHYSLRQSIIAIAGMLTVPRLQANCYRLELLAQLATSNCRGNVIPTDQDFLLWLNEHLGSVAYMEDPVEDVFVMNVISRDGDFRVLGGLWEVPDAATNLLFECIERYGGPEQEEWLKPAKALLALSDLVLQRANLNRWDTEASEPKGKIDEFISAEIEEWGKRIVITATDLAQEGIDVDLLRVFVLTDNEISGIRSEKMPGLALYRKPLLQFGNDLVLALPTAVIYAIRLFVIEQAASVGQLRTLQNALMNCVVTHATRSMHGSNHGVESIAIPRGLAGQPEHFHSFVFRVGQRRLIHLLILSDPLEEFGRACMDRPAMLSENDEATIHDHVVTLRGHLEHENEIDFGYSIVLLGHLGQGIALTPLPEHQKWTSLVTRLNFLQMILQDSDAPLDKLISLLTQLTMMEAAGIHLKNYNGLLNLYAYWEKQGHSLRIPEMPHDRRGYLQIATDFLMPFRSTRRKVLDEHCEVTVRGASVTVIRANSDSIYATVKQIPAYVSISHLQSGILTFCIRLDGTTVWVRLVAKTEDTHHHRMLRELWEALQILVYRILQTHEPPLRFHSKAVEIILDFTHVMPGVSAHENPSFSDELEMFVHGELPIVKLVAGAGFLRLFSGVSNVGEQKLLAYVIAALRELAKLLPDTSEDGDAEVLRILGGEDAKILHTFQANGSVDYLLAMDDRRTFRMPNEQINAVIHAAFIWMKSPEERLVLNKQQSCTTLNTAVAELLKPLVAKLARFDRKALIVDLLHSHETLLRDQQRWRATARAVRALYGVQDGTEVAHRAEQERTQAKLTLRALAEAAVCECPTSGGISPDGHSIDELFSLMWTIIELGRDSDTIYHDLSSEGITIYPSGAYSFNADVLAEIGGNYTIDSFRTNYEAAAADYESWVLPKGEGKESRSQFQDVFESEEYRQAFRAEFGLDSEKFVDIWACLIDIAHDRESVIVTIPRAELVAYCSNRDIGDQDVDAFLAAFALPARPTWAPQKPLAEPRDVVPWKFERRFSIMLRPLVECKNSDDTNYVYGIATANQAMGYILEAIAFGKFDKDVFSSMLMRSYIGRRVDALGRAFTEKVAQTLRDLGWQARTEVKMTTLGAGKNPDLGDIDVLAWTSDGRVLIIECKRLKTSRTIAEIAQTCQRFQGNAGDHLFKHLRRFEWLTQNKDKLACFIGIPVDATTFRSPLVTNRHVPFRYIRNLPLSSENIWFFVDLARYASLSDPVLTSHNLGLGG